MTQDPLAEMHGPVPAHRQHGEAREQGGPRRHHRPAEVKYPDQGRVDHGEGEILAHVRGGPEPVKRAIQVAGRDVHRRVRGLRGRESTRSWQPDARRCFEVGVRDPGVKYDA
eukprot:5994239-Pyramimonas_sp.AAC.1